MALPNGQHLDLSLDDGRGGQVACFQVTGLTDAAHISVLVNAIEAQLGYRFRHAMPEQRTVYHVMFEK